MKLTQKQVQHLLLRASFGDSLPVVQRYAGKSPEYIFEDQLEKVRTATPEVKGEINFVPYDPASGMDKDEISKMRKVAQQDIKDLNKEWIRAMASSPSGMLDKMAFFWHDHFACRSNNPLFMANYLDELRTHSLGNFGDLLRAISKSPAMLEYLNNQQNRKMAPNENFARELMELFTLGRDRGYTERDISEAARAFTGWTFDQSGKFHLREKVHDGDEKTIFGRTDFFDGDEVIDMLLEKKETAIYISEKLVKFFVNYEGDTGLTRSVANAFYESNYSIPAAMQMIFTSSDFFQPGNIARRIKSPIELIVALQRQLFVQIDDVPTLVYLQRSLGQLLFDPPNVAGWPDGKAWVDSSTLMTRIMLPQYIFKAAILESEVSDSFDDNDQFKLSGPVRKLKAHVNYEALDEAFQKLSTADIGQFLLQSDVGNTPVKSMVDAIIHFTSKPEYQLC